MSLTFINSNYFSGSSGTDYATINKPTNTTDGDIMFAFLSSISSLPNTSPTGWTKILDTSPNGNYHSLWYKIASSEGANYTWGYASSQKLRGLIVTYRSSDFNTKNVIDVISNTQYTEANTTLRAASMNTYSTGEILLFFGFAYESSNRTFTKPSNIGTDAWEENYDAGDTGSDIYQTVCSMLWSGSGATGNMDGTISSSMSNKHAIAIALHTPTAVTTQAVSSITTTTATGNGNVTSDGGATITERGICIGSNANPTTAGTKFTTSGTTGAFTVSITGLTRATPYHVRAYATNSIETVYGTDVTFTTLAELPTVATTSVNSISQTGVIALGNLSDNGGETPNEIGFCWKTTSNPVITDDKLVVYSSLGAFNGLISGLTANTTYYVRAYATNSIGTSYGANVSFKTLTSGPMIKRRISFLSKAQSLTIQLSNNAIDETFTVLQFAVAGEKQEKKTFTPGSIVSIN